VSLQQVLAQVLAVAKRLATLMAHQVAVEAVQLVAVVAQPSCRPKRLTALKTEMQAVVVTHVFIVHRGRPLHDPMTYGAPHEALPT
jgi:hypothetical protein